MAQFGQQIEKLRYKLGMNQTDFGELFGRTAMSVSRWERGTNLPSSRELIRLGLLAEEAGSNGWQFLELGGLKQADARAMLFAQARTVAAGRP
jgi:transcriptional regulator with XRE-family HTH domain